MTSAARSRRCRPIAQEIELYRAMHRFIPILMHQRGARCTEIVARHRPRVAGVTKYGIRRTLTILLDLVTVKYVLDYSAQPMRLFGGLGLACWAVSQVARLATLAMKLFGGMDLVNFDLRTSERRLEHRRVRRERRLVGLG